jgi:hypothetical protein
MIASVGEPGFQRLRRRRRILRPEPLIVRVRPPHFAAALMRWSLDPELLLGTGPPDDGRLDGTALSFDQNPIEYEA